MPQTLYDECVSPQLAAYVGGQDPERVHVIVASDVARGASDADQLWHAAQRRVRSAVERPAPQGCVDRDKNGLNIFASGPIDSLLDPGVFSGRVLTPSPLALTLSAPQPVTLSDNRQTATPSPLVLTLVPVATVPGLITVRPDPPSAFRFLPREAHQRLAFRGSRGAGR